MSNLNDYCLDYRDFSLHYKPIRKSNNPQLGDVQLFKHKPTGRIVQAKEQLVDQEEDLNELLASLERFLVFNSCEFFLAFIGFSIRQQQMPIRPTKAISKCSVYMIYEYMDNDLEREAMDRMKKGEFFSESLVWKILQTLAICLEIIVKNGRRIGDIRPNNVYFSKQDNTAKILFTNYNKTAFDLILAKKIPYYRCFLAPEQLAVLGEKRPCEKGLDLAKCEVFSIAAMILSVVCLQNKERMYNIQEMGLVGEGIKSKLSWFKEKYSNSLSKLFEIMMNVNEALRPSIAELNFAILRNLNPNITKQLSESTIPKHHTTFNSFDSNALLDKDSLSLQPLLNDSKSTKDKTNFSLNSKEIILLDSSSLQRSIDLRDPINQDGNGTPGLQIQEKDLRTGSILIEETERKVSFFEKVKQTELKPQRMTSSLHKRYASEVTGSKKNMENSVRTMESSKRISQELKLVNSLETSLEEETRVQKLIKKLERKLIYEKNNPSILNANMQRLQYADGSLYIGTVRNGVRHGKGIYYFSQREVYGGDWKNDQFDGHGVYIYDNGDIYEGDLKSGLKQGKGIYYYVNGNKYDGDWSENQKCGFGIFYFKGSKEKFEGSWARNEKSGPGVYYFSNGDRFEGTWLNGLKTGPGTVHFSDTSTFSGLWVDNTPQGPGTLHYSNGDTYSGSFLCGTKEGEGIYKHTLGSVYEGTWKNDERTGKGVINYSNGDKYQGGIMNGFRFGFGVYWYSFGARYEGDWRDNERWGNGRLILNDKSQYEGQWIAGKRGGYGAMAYENGEKYEGGWKEDMKEGKGTYLWANGTKYCGNWKEDKMHGEGTYWDEEGEEIFGLWVNGQFWEKC